MCARKLLERDDDTRKVFLSENSFDVSDILNRDYGYIADSIADEGIILKGKTCNLFKELVYENKVVGFCTYDFSAEFITAALNNIYVLPDFRGRGLFLNELKTTMAEYNKPSIVEPTRLVVELLIEYGFAKIIGENIAASSIEFIVPGDHVESNGQYQNEELSTHFYDMEMSACIHFLNLDRGILAYSSPLNYDIIHYDCIGKRKGIDEEYFTKIRDFFISNDAEIMNEITSLEEKLSVKSYTLEEVVGGEGEFSPYILSLIDDAHVTYEKAVEIKQQMIEEYDAGMILNESLLIRLAYLFDSDRELSIRSHSDTCPYCGMPTDPHDRFCHFCGINLNYDSGEMFESLLSSFSFENTESEDIAYVSYKFLRMICEGIDFEYAAVTCENAYDIDWDILEEYLSENTYIVNNSVTEKGRDFMKKHPLHMYEKYCLTLYDYSDFEKFFIRNTDLNPKERVLKYISQFDDEESIVLKKEINGNLD